MPIDKELLEELKKHLEEKIQQLQKEIEMYKALLEVVDVLYKNRDELLTAKPGEEVIQVKSPSGEVIANMYIGHDYIRAVPLVPMPKNIPPLTTYLISRVLDEMKRREEELAERGEIKKEEVLSYDIREEEGLLKEIMVKNIKSERDFVELKAAIRWTLQKMYDKIKK